MRYVCSRAELFFFFFFNDTATTEIYTLSPTRRSSDLLTVHDAGERDETLLTVNQPAHGATLRRSEEHTSELQSLAYLVCRLLLEKKKKTLTLFPSSKKKKKK